MQKCLALLATSIALVTCVAAQAQDEDLKAAILDCVLNRQGQWIDPSLYADGKVRFTYVLLRTTETPQLTTYVAFWNRSKTEGKLLVFRISTTPNRQLALANTNEAWIWNDTGKLDLRDLQGGLYVYENVKSQLPKLHRRRPAIQSVKQIQRTSAVCSSPRDVLLEAATEKWVVDLPGSPITLTTRSPTGYRARNSTQNRIATYTLGCVTEARGKLTVVHQISAKGSSIVPGGSRGAAIADAPYLEEYAECVVQRKAKLAVIEVSFDDGTDWRGLAAPTTEH